MPHANADGSPPSDYLYYRHSLAVAPHALDERRRADDPADERAADLQRASASLLGRQVVVHRQPPDPRDRREAMRRDRRHGHDPHLRPRVRHDRRPRRVEDGRRPAGRARFSLVDDDPGQSVAVDGAGVALLLRLGAADQRPRVRHVLGGEPASRARPRAGPRRAGARSASRFSTTCASGIRPARRRSATTCCRSSRISW